jgi:hypothetical protein
MMRKHWHKLAGSVALPDEVWELTIGLIEPTRHVGTANL